METKDYMFGFIWEHQKNYVPETYIEEILSVELKEDDDDHGKAGEHYVVRLKHCIPKFTFTAGNQYELVEATCLVNVKQFNHYVEKNQAVIWI